MSDASTILRRASGTWQGEETMPPAPWAPEGMTAYGRTEGRVILGGSGVASDYEQRIGGPEGNVTLTAHTVIRHDADTGSFTMHFISSAGGPAMEMDGRAVGNDTLIFESRGPDGAMRQTFVYGEETMEVRAEAQDPESGEWALSFEGRYERAGG